MSRVHPDDDIPLEDADELLDEADLPARGAAVPSEAPDIRSVDVPRNAETPWRPTWALHRALLIGLGGSMLAVLTRRVDIAVLALPLLGVALWSVLGRPLEPTRSGAALDRTTLREEVPGLIVAAVDAPDAAEISVSVLPREGVALYPPRGAVVDRAIDGFGQAALSLSPRRYGEHPLGPVTITASSVWASFRATCHSVDIGQIFVLPRGEVFSARRGLPRPAGLVGQGLAARPGRGTELAVIRPFTAGDRLRRIHWPATQRAGQLHVSTTFGEEDSRLLLMVDATADLGDDNETLGTSLDQTVRGAAAVAEHFLHRGDRVGVRVVTPDTIHDVPTRSGRAHAVRLNGALAQVTVKSRGPRPPSDVIRLGVRHPPIAPGTVVVAFSPVMSPRIRAQLTDIARGHTLILVDTLPASLRKERPALYDEGWACLDEVGRPDLLISQAWRIRLLERERDCDALSRQAGVPVVPWQGPGTLDAVLSHLQRRSRAAREVRR